MKKLILCVSVAVTTALSYQYVTANENSSKDNVKTAIASSPDSAISIDAYIGKVYDQIDFGNHAKLDSAIFQKAYYGYLNLRNDGKLSDDKDILTICDFSKSSTQHRLWVIDLRARKLLINDYVAHGQGSGDEFATQFSNTSNSHQSSLGFYVTDETYIGKHGLSLHLRGMDQGYNNLAYERSVVVHGADYVCDAFVAGQKRLGRSWGCPAVSNKIAGNFINTIKNGTVLFIYAPQQQYLQSSQWLTRKITQLPASNTQLALNGTAHTGVSTIY